MTISTLSLMRSSYLSVAENQKRLSEAQIEQSTGRLSNIGAALGASTSQAIDLRAATDRNSVEIELNGLASSELKGLQSGLTSLTDLAHSFTATLIGARNAQNGQQVVKDAAKNALKQMQEILNVTQDGKALFSGINTSTSPLADYFSAVPPASKNAIDSAFLSEFGTPQNGSAVSNITAAQMDTFINGNFKTQFDATNWSSNWSNAGSQNRQIRIADSFQAQISVNANDQVFRNLTMAITMAFDLGSGSLNQAAFEKLVDKSASIAGAASADLGDVSSSLGIVQKQITDQNNQLTQRNDILNQTLTRLEGVDQFEVATRINTLTTQLEASYSLTARINKLSLLNYL